MPRGQPLLEEIEEILVFFKVVERVFNRIVRLGVEQPLHHGFVLLLYFDNLFLAVSLHLVLDWVSVLILGKEDGMRTWFFIAFSCFTKIYFATLERELGTYCSFAWSKCCPSSTLIGLSLVYAKCWWSFEI